MLESELKTKGTKLLESWGWLVVHIIQCNKNGWPDSQIYRQKVTYHIEWKQPGQQPRELQNYRIRKLREQGFETLVITDLRQLEILK
jgi:hypothetical protein